MSSSGEDLVQNFNHTLHVFLDKLKAVYAAVPDFAMNIESSQSLLRVMPNKALVIDQLYDIVWPHNSGSGEILSVDREQFIKTVLPTITAFRAFHISDNWEHTNETTKAAIWDYIKALWKLSHCHRNSVTAPAPVELFQQYANILSDENEFRKVLEVGRDMLKRIDVEQMKQMLASPEFVALQQVFQTGSAPSGASGGSANEMDE